MAFIRYAFRMGSIYSSRWHGHKRKITVEECRRLRATRCPRCGQRVQFVHIPPCEVNAACAKCLDLTWNSRRVRRTLAGELGRDVFRLVEVRREALDLLSQSMESTPPDEIVKQGRRATRRWFRENAAVQARAFRLLHFTNRVPVLSEMRAMERAQKASD